MILIRHNPEWETKRPTDPRFKDVSGEKFGLLTVLCYAGHDYGGTGKRYNVWLVECSGCGTQKRVPIQSLKNGTLRSCGQVGCRTIKRNPGAIVPCLLCRKEFPCTEDFFHRKKRMAAGLSGYCKRCACHIAKTKGYHSRKNNRKKVLEYYSNGAMECACCKENTLEFLSLDHIDGRGRQKRLAGESSSRLIKLGFPPGYRVLCHNCNMSLGVYGYCPHSKKIPTKYQA